MKRQRLERLCRCITRPAIANERVKRNQACQVVLQPWPSLAPASAEPAAQNGKFSAPTRPIAPRCHYASVLFEEKGRLNFLPAQDADGAPSAEEALWGQILHHEFTSRLGVCSLGRLTDLA